MKKINLKAIALLFFGILFLSMKSSNSKILFLTLKIEKDKQTQIENVSIVNKVVVDGQFKGSYATENIRSKSVLILSFLSENKSLIHQIEIENPLNSNIESFDINGTMQRHAVKSDQIEFNIRVRYEDTMKLLRISKKEENKQAQTITDIDLTL